MSTDIDLTETTSDEQIFSDTSSTTTSLFDIIISIIAGIILGIILYKGYIRPPLIKGPNSRDIVGKIFQVGDKYYELEPVVCGCLKK